MNYWGPYQKGWNILEDLSILLQHDPTSDKKCNYTMAEAENLYQEAIKSETRVIRKLNYEFDTCRLYLKFPEKYKIVGFVFLGEGRFWSRPTTIDAVAKGMIETMKSGANGMVVMKNSADFSVSSWGAGIGVAYTHGGLKGSEKDWYDSGSGGTGLAYSSVKPKSTPVLVGVMIQDEQGIKGLEKSGAK
jgi:hypothetical protein